MSDVVKHLNNVLPVHEAHQETFFSVVEVLLAGTYQVVSTGQPVAMHPSSVLFGKQPTCVVFNEIVWTTKQYMVSVAAVEQQWLREAGSQYFH